MAEKFRRGQGTGWLGAGGGEDKKPDVRATVLQPYHFYAQLSPDHNTTGKLVIPGFFHKCGPLPSWNGVVRLSVMDGPAWEVVLLKCGDGSGVFTEGWSDFVNRYRVQPKDVMLFGYYHMTQHFSVVVCGEDCWEVCSPLGSGDNCLGIDEQPPVNDGITGPGYGGAQVVAPKQKQLGSLSHSRPAHNETAHTQRSGSGLGQNSGTRNCSMGLVGFGGGQVPNIPRFVEPMIEPPEISFWIELPDERDGTRSHVEISYEQFPALRDMTTRTWDFKFRGKAWKVKLCILPNHASLWTGWGRFVKDNQLTSGNIVGFVANANTGHMTVTLPEVESLGTLNF